MSSVNFLIKSYEKLIIGFSTDYIITYINNAIRRQDLNTY